MKRNRLKLVLLGIAVFLIGLIVKFPASIGVALATDFVPGFSVGSASGTIWNGRIEQAAIGMRSADTISWDLHAVKLLALRAAADVEIRLDNNTLTAHVAAAPGGTVTLDNLRGNLRLQTLSKLQLMPANFARGDVLLDIESLRMEEGRITEATGRAQLTGLRSDMLAGVPLGDYAGTLESGEAGIQASFRDANAPLELQGTATLSPDGSYTTRGTVRPTSDTPEQLRNGMAFLGRPDNNGRYSFQFSGRL